MIDQNECHTNISCATLIEKVFEMSSAYQHLSLCFCFFLLFIPFSIVKGEPLQRPAPTTNHWYGKDHDSYTYFPNSNKYATWNHRRHWSSATACSHTGISEWSKISNLTPTMESVRGPLTSQPVCLRSTTTSFSRATSCPNNVFKLCAV